MLVIGVFVGVVFRQIK